MYVYRRSHAQLGGQIRARVQYHCKRRMCCSSTEGTQTFSRNRGNSNRDCRRSVDHQVETRGMEVQCCSETERMCCGPACCCCCCHRHHQTRTWAEAGAEQGEGWGTAVQETMVKMGEGTSGRPKYRARKKCLPGLDLRLKTEIG